MYTFTLQNVILQESNDDGVGYGDGDDYADAANDDDNDNINNYSNND